MSDAPLTAEDPAADECVDVLSDKLLQAGDYVCASVAEPCFKRVAMRPVRAVIGKVADVAQLPLAAQEIRNDHQVLPDFRRES